MNKKQEQFNNSDYTQSLIKNAKGSTGMFYANNDYFVPPRVQRYLTSQQQTTIISTSNDNNSDKNTKSIEEEEGEFNEFVEMLRQSNHPSAIPLNSMHTFYNKQNNQQQQQQFNSSGSIVDPKLVFEQSNQYAPRMMMLNEDDDSTTTTTTTTPTTTTTTTDTTTPLTIENTNNNSDSNNTINSQQQSFMYSDEQFMNQMELFEQYKQFNQQMNASQMDEQRHIQLLQLKDQLKLTSQIYQTCYHRCLGHKSHHLNLRLYMGQKMDQKKSSNGQDEEEYILSVNEKESIVECVNKEYDTFERTRKQFLNHFISKNQNEYSEMANHVYQYVHSAPSSSSSSSPQQQNTKLNRFQQSTAATAPFLLPTTDNSSSSNTSGSSSSSTTGGGSALGRLVAPSPPSSNQKQQ